MISQVITYREFCIYCRVDPLLGICDCYQTIEEHKSEYPFDDVILDFLFFFEDQDFLVNKMEIIRNFNLQDKKKIRWDTVNVIGQIELIGRQLIIIGRYRYNYEYETYEDELGNGIF